MKRFPATWHTLSCLLIVVMLAAACNDDDDGPSETVTGPDLGTELPLDAAVLAELNSAVEKAIGLLFVGGGTVPGADSGQITVTGSTFVFEQYSPDGVFVLDGQLVMDLLVAPITVKGDMSFVNGELEGPIVVDMTLDASTDPVTYGGTVTVAGEVIDVSTIDQG